MTLEQLEKIIEARKQVNEAIDKLSEAGFDINGQLFEAIWRGQTCADKIIDPDGCISWWLDEGGTIVTIDGVKREIKTVKDLHEAFFAPQVSKQETK